MRKCISIALVVLTAAALPAPALAATSNSQLWANGSVTVKLSDHWRLQEEGTVRFSDNRNGLYEIESNTLLGYRLSRMITVWAGYTHNPQYSGGDFTVMEHRAREQVTFDGFAMLGKGKLNGRIRFEQRWRENVDGTGWRVRPYLKYSVPIAGKTALNLSTKPFLQPQHDAVPAPNRSRPCPQPGHGLDSRSPETLTGELGYMNQHGFVRGGPDTSDNIAYFGLSLSI